MHALVGRQAELETIEAFVARVVDGPHTLVLEGEPGIGKSSLWLAGVGSAVDRGAQVLVARPTGTESSMAFAALGDLLADLGSADVDRLAEPQRRALRVALLQEEPHGRPPDPRAVAVAVLNLLRSLSEQAPVLVAIDDVQWLDVGSAMVLAFAARRLRGEPVGMLLARRIGPDVHLSSGTQQWLDADDIERLQVPSLGADDMRRLLRDRLDHALPLSTVLHIHQASGGHPLYALEIGRLLVASGLELGAGADLPLPDSLRHSSPAMSPPCRQGLGTRSPWRRWPTDPPWRQSPP